MIIYAVPLCMIAIRAISYELLFESDLDRCSELFHPPETKQEQNICMYVRLH